MMVVSPYQAIADKERSWPPRPPNAPHIESIQLVGLAGLLGGWFVEAESAGGAAAPSSADSCALSNATWYVGVHRRVPRARARASKASVGSGRKWGPCPAVQ